MALQPEAQLPDSVSINLVGAMITVKVTRDENDLVRGFRVCGHAEYAEQGSDVVCAAVSALMQAALLGLTEIEKLDFKYRTGKSLLEFQLPELSKGCSAERVNFLMATVYASLRRIEERYSEFIRVEEVLPQNGKNKGENKERSGTVMKEVSKRKSAN